MIHWIVPVGLLALSLSAEAGLPAPGTPGAPADSRYCGEPARAADGRILRDRSVVRRFIATWPRPQDGRVWYVDHVIPLAVGGCDMGHNLQWLPADLKNCPGTCKDRFERWVYDPSRR